MKKNKEEHYEVRIFRDRVLDYLRYSLEKRLKRLEVIEKIFAVLFFIFLLFSVGSIFSLAEDINKGIIPTVLFAIATYLSLEALGSVNKEIEIIEYTLSYGRYLVFEPVELKQELRSWRKEADNK